jgi:hypothetical protein
MSKVTTLFLGTHYVFSYTKKILKEFIEVQISLLDIFGPDNIQNRLNFFVSLSDFLISEESLIEIR